jgi:hypothetical protein
MIPTSDEMRHVIMGWGKPLVALRKHGVKVPAELPRLLAIATDLIVHECNQCRLASPDERPVIRNRVWGILWAVMLILKSYAVSASLVFDMKTEEIYSELQKVCQLCREVLNDKSPEEQKPGES